MAATAPPYPEAMTPESSEGRERMARLEVQVDANKRQIETLGSLPLAVERVQWRLDELAESLKKAEVARLDESRELRRAFSDQILVVTDGLKGCSTKINEVAEAQRKWQESDRDRREAEREKRENEAKAANREAEQGKVQRLIARYGAITALTVVLISSLTSLVIAFFGGT